MVIDAMGGALQLETGNSDVYKFISGRTYDTVWVKHVSIIHQVYANSYYCTAPTSTKYFKKNKLVKGKIIID
jgi:hypothetical protein